MTDPVFSLSEPVTRTSCAIFNSPHSGFDYGGSFMKHTLLDAIQIRSSEDAFVDALFAAAPDFGAPLMAARVPRACVDLNRAPEDLDPALIQGASRRYLNPRIAAGLGVIPRVVAEGRPIMHGKIPLAEAHRRIDTYHRPYHARLWGLLEESRSLFGMAILFDCHSMPHDALVSAPSIAGKRPNVILGDRFGASCERWLIDAADDAFTAAGFVVARNAPFAGGYITQCYGHPRKHLHALQIEVDRAIYMNERRLTPLPAFDDVRRAVANVISTLSALGPEPLNIAAE